MRPRVSYFFVLEGLGSVKLVDGAEREPSGVRAGNPDEWSVLGRGEPGSIPRSTGRQAGDTLTRHTLRNTIPL